MVNAFGKWLLFLSSYFPLYILLCIKHWHVLGRSLPFTVTLAVLAAIAAAGTVFLLVPQPNKRLELDSGARPVNCSMDIISYFLSYLMPLLSMDITDPINLIINGLVYLLIGAVYVSGERVYLNPLLLLFGYSLYQAGEDKLISRKKAETIRSDLQANGFLDARMIAPHTYFVK